MRRSTFVRFLFPLSDLLCSFLTVIELERFVKAFPLFKKPMHKMLRPTLQEVRSALKESGQYYTSKKLIYSQLCNFLLIIFKVDNRAQNAYVRCLSVTKKEYFTWKTTAYRRTFHIVLNGLRISNILNSFNIIAQKCLSRKFCLSDPCQWCTFQLKDIM
jgi:hypothetical protein